MSFAKHVCMIDHNGLGVADIARSAAFYDAALGALGLRRVVELPAGDGSDAIGYGLEYPVSWIDHFHPHGVKQHTAFVARTRSQVDALHAAALSASGIDTGSPGYREATVTRRATTLPSCSIRMATLKPCSASGERAWNNPMLNQSA